MALIDIIKAEFDQGNPERDIATTFDNGLTAAERAQKTGNYPSTGLSTGEHDISLRLEEAESFDRLLQNTRSALAEKEALIFDTVVDDWRRENAARIAALQNKH